MKRKLIALITAAVLAVLGVFSLVSYANKANDRAFEGAELVKVLVVKNDIPVDTPVDRIGGNVETKEIPRTVLAEGAIADLGEVSGLSTNTALKPGEQVLKSRFGSKPGKGSRTTLPSGMQEVSITLEPPRIAGGSLKVGDTVGVLASYSSTDNSGGETNFVKNRVLVVRVEDTVALGDDQKTVSTPLLITLAVSASDAKKIVNAAEFGKVWLTLQNSDTDTGSSDKIESKDVIK